MGSYPNYANGEAEPQKLTSSASYKSKKKPASAISRAGSEADDIFALLHGSDPVRVELTRLENEVREKDRELGDAQAEIKALKYSERLKEKAVEEVDTRKELIQKSAKIVDLEHLDI